MASASSAASIDPKLVISHKFVETSFSYSERDAAIYALGVGACAGDAVDEKELKYVYHPDGQRSIEVLPTFAALFQLKSKNGFMFPDVSGLEFDPRLLLHGQQYIEIYKPFPSSCSVKNRVTVAGLHDKGKAAIIEVETTSYVEESGEALCMNRSTSYLRGAGGFSKSSKPYSYANYPADQVSSASVPKHKPSVIYEDQTQQSQANSIAGNQADQRQMPQHPSFLEIKSIITNESPTRSDLEYMDFNPRRVLLGWRDLMQDNCIKKKKLSSSKLRSKKSTKLMDFNPRRVLLGWSSTLEEFF